MCYPSIGTAHGTGKHSNTVVKHANVCQGLGSAHTLGVALVSSAIGGMCSTWIKFGDVVAGSSGTGEHTGRAKQV